MVRKDSLKSQDQGGEEALFCAYMNVGNTGQESGGAYMDCTCKMNRYKMPLLTIWSNLYGHYICCWFRPERETEKYSDRVLFLLM